MELEDALSSNDSEIYFASASCGPRRVSIGDCFWSSLSKVGRCFLLRLEALYIPVQRRLRQDRAISRMASVSVFYPTGYVSREVNYGLKLKRVNAPVSASGVVCVGFHRVFLPPVDYEVLRHPKPLTLTLEDFFSCIAPDGNTVGNWAETGFDLPNFLASTAYCKRESRGKVNVLVMSMSSFNRLQRYAVAHQLFGWSREQLLGYIGDGCLAQCPAGTKVFFCRRKHPLYHVNRHSTRQESLAPKRKGELRTLGKRSEQECISELQLRVKVDVRSLRQKRQPGGGGGSSGSGGGGSGAGGRTGRGRPKRSATVVAGAAAERLPSKAARQPRRRKTPSTAAARAASAAATAPGRKRRLARRKKGRPPKKRPKLEPAAPEESLPLQQQHQYEEVPSPPISLPPPSPPTSPPQLPPSLSFPSPPPSLPLPAPQQVALPMPRKRGRPRKLVAAAPEAAAMTVAAVLVPMAIADISITSAAATEEAVSAQNSIDSVIENVLNQTHEQAIEERRCVAEDVKPSHPSPVPPPPPLSPFQLRLETISPAAPGGEESKMENEPVSPPTYDRSEHLPFHHQHQMFQHPHQMMQLPFTAADDPAVFLQQWTPRHMQFEAAAAAAAAAAASSMPTSPFPHHLHHQQLQHLQHLQQLHNFQQKLAAPQPQSMWVPQKTPCYGAPPLQMPYPGLTQAFPLGHQRFASLPTFLQSQGATLVPVIIANHLPQMSHAVSSTAATSPAAPPITSSAAAAAATAGQLSHLPHPGLFLPQVNLYHHGDS